MLKLSRKELEIQKQLFKTDSISIRNMLPDSEAKAMMSRLEDRVLHLLGLMDMTLAVQDPINSLVEDFFPPKHPSETELEISQAMVKRWKKKYKRLHRKLK